MQEDTVKNEKYFQNLGLKCGLEIHQQLKTKKKLFCRCKAVLHNDKPSAEILRHMRPTLSELGEYDGTALMEFKTKKNVIYQLYDDIIYRINRETVCTYEMDDTPPFNLNKKALEIAIEIALMHNCSIVDELHISRKQYLDGSIPTGFQRTGIIGIEGNIPYKNRKIGIIQIGLEEDACREVSDVGHKIIFKTDRLSIPLVEVVTYPDIKTPKEAAEVANIIGRIMRSTGKVRRGLGSVRQDVNVSIKGGTRVELKGVPKLQYIENAVEKEAKRQKFLLKIRDELKIRGINEKKIQGIHKDVTSIFKDSKCIFFNEAIKKNKKIYGILLNGFAGILDKPTQPNKTFADEISGRVRVIACIDNVPNLIYTNQFEKFNVSKKEIKKLDDLFKPKLTDCLVLVWGNESDVLTAVKEVKIRAVDATRGVPSETRQVFPDGTNDFERILPGPDRMYPDTDSPPTPILEKDLIKIKTKLPEPLWDCEDRLKKLGLSHKLVNSLSISKNLKLFDSIIEKVDIDPILVAVTLEETLKHLKRKGKKVELINKNNLVEIFKNFKENNFSKEAIPVIIEYLIDNPGKNLKDSILELNIKPINHKELVNIVDKSIMKFTNNNNKIIRPFNTIMGEIMKSARCRVDGEIVKELVEEKIKN